MRILFSTPTSKQYINCPKLSDQQVVCGPSWETERNNLGYTSIKTPHRMYDLKDSVSMLSDGQQPEMVIVWADSSMVNVPCNLKKFNCPRILLVGDTHHMQRPLQNLITYAKSEPFDYVITINNRQHGHFFTEAGIKNMYWLPGFGAQIFPFEFNEKRDMRFVFIGQVGRFHPRRIHLIPDIVKSGIPLFVGQFPAIKAAEFYSASLGSFHCSLNGDISFRNFEVLSAGGMLLGDKLSEQSGMHLLFEDGKHWVSYNSLKDLKQKMKYYLSHPREALEIARNGYKEFWLNHSPEKKKEEFFRLVLQQQVNPLYDLSLEKRVNYFSVEQLPQLDRQRVQHFEFIQEQHRQRETVMVCCWPKVSPRVICDIADLPRVNLQMINNPDKASLSLNFEQAGVKDKIEWVDNVKNGQNDIVILTSNELLGIGQEQLANISAHYIIIADRYQEQIVDVLHNAGFEKEVGEHSIFKKMLIKRLGSINAETMREQITKFSPWFHTIELLDGIKTPGQEDLHSQVYGLRDVNFTNLRVLDIGSGEGYWTFEALKRGAKEVVAIDINSLPQETSKTSFDDKFAFCCSVLGYDSSRCKRIAMSIYDITHAQLGYFDIVLLFGQLHKLRHPLLALERLSAMCTDKIYIESAILDDYSPYSGPGKEYAGKVAMEFYPESQYSNDPNVWWVPTIHCLGKMVNAAGFKKVQGWKVADRPININYCKGFVQGYKKE